MGRVGERRGGKMMQIQCKSPIKFKNRRKKAHGRDPCIHPHCSIPFLSDTVGLGGKKGHQSSSGVYCLVVKSLGPTCGSTQGRTLADLGESEGKES